MKVAILTMNYVYNYGGILQCLALQKTLESKGIEVVVIRFSSNKKGNIKKKLKLLFTDFSLKSYMDRALNELCGVFTKHKQLPPKLLSKCSAFIAENIHYTELCDEQTIGKLVQQINPDAIVIGSDKIWGVVADEQLVYFGDWHPTFNGRLISYAACSSREHIPSFCQQKIRNLFLRFNAISVRDEYTKKLFQPLAERNIPVVADPTMLYDFQEYYADTKTQPYILTYILGREIRGGHMEALNEIKSKVGNLAVKSIVISVQATDIVTYADDVIYDCSPSEWLNLIRQAAFVYTDSFHGIMFSMKFQKPFVGYYREFYRASRLLDLERYYELSPWIVSSVLDMKEKRSCTQEINYEKIQAQINLLRDKSLFYLSKALA